MKRITLLSMDIQNFKGCTGRTIDFADKTKSAVQTLLERQLSLMRLHSYCLTGIHLGVLILISDHLMQTER